MKMKSENPNVLYLSSLKIPLILLFREAVPVQEILEQVDGPIHGFLFRYRHRRNYYRNRRNT